MSILAKLDAAYAQTQNSDQIVTLIQCGGWIKVQDMTEEYWQENKSLPHKIIWMWRGRPIVNNWTMDTWDTLGQLKRINNDADYWTINAHFYKEDSVPFV